MTRKDNTKGTNTTETCEQPSSAIERQPSHDIEVHTGNSSEPRASGESDRGRAQEGWTYRPAVDVIVGAKEYWIFADVPGATSESIDVTFEDGLLTIGARIEPRSSGRVRVHRQEYGVGSFHRRFRLDESIDPSAISGEFRDGVLALRLPKSQRSERRRIEIRPA